MNNTCLPLADIQKELNVIYTHFIYLNYYIDVKDYNNPIKPLYGAELLQGSVNNYRTDLYYHKIIDFITDSGFILESPETTTTYQLDSKNSILIPGNTGIAFKMLVSISNLKDIYQRKYVKVQTILANTGGFIKFLMLLFQVFNSYFSDFDHANYFYENLDKKQDKFRKSMENNVNIFESQNTNTLNNNYTNLSSNNRTAPNKTLVDIKSMDVSTIRFKKMTTLEMICGCLYKSKEYKEKKQFKDNLMNFFKQQLDVKNILRLTVNNELTDKALFGKVGKQVKDNYMNMYLLKALRGDNKKEDFNSLQIKQFMEKLNNDRTILNKKEQLLKDLLLEN